MPSVGWVIVPSAVSRAPAASATSLMGQGEASAGVVLPGDALVCAVPAGDTAVSTVPDGDVAVFAEPAAVGVPALGAATASACRRSRGPVSATTLNGAPL